MSSTIVSIAKQLAETDIDRRECERVVPMKVLILGLGCTSTDSIHKALEILKYDQTYHMNSCLEQNPKDCDMWVDAFKAKYDDKGEFGVEQWDQLLGHCMAVTDFPAACFGPELIAAYPDAKVILTNVDVDEWYSSILKTLHWRMSEPGLYWLSLIDPGYSRYAPMFYKMFETFFKGDFVANGKAVHEDHYREIRSLVPKDRLLELNVAEDAWPKLCQFLEVEVPEEPFPDVDEVSLYQARCQRMNEKKRRALLRRVAVMFAVFVLVFSFLVHEWT